MATASFKEDLVVENPKKIQEIVVAMQQPRNDGIKPATPPQLPKNAGVLWFKRSEK